MRSARITPVAALVAAILFPAVLLPTACKGDAAVDKVRVNGGDAHIAARDSARALGPGDIRIASTDDAIDLSLIGDSLMAGFGAKTRQKVADATDTTRVKGTGFAADIEKMVKKTVAGALDHEIHFPLSSISDVRYQDGALQFYAANGKPMHMFERSNHDEHVVFTQQDANAFIAAFKLKKAAH